ncbi:hypothetical protein GCM10007216_04390 [Thalassobacillus devorans]|uniref:Uncharacterized protein n=1 Tax=Thalassobacillus devorans TaxID=279813 RepID=A0ABQ1NH25_9BACI|nr:hypothetical protein GCM10007216_04390 [Thalassobacillus devorans]
MNFEALIPSIGYRKTVAIVLYYASAIGHNSVTRVVLFLYEKVRLLKRKVLENTKALHLYL